MFDESVTSFYSVGDYIQVDDNRGWIIEDNGFGAFHVITDTSKLINVNELDIDFRDNSKSIGLKDIAALKANYLDIIEVEVVYGCTHNGTISCKIDDAGPEQSMALSELCKECDNKVTELQIEEEYKKSLCRNHEECSKETMCNGQSLISGDDKHYCFKRQLIEETDPYYCSRMNAFCPKAPTCYGEHIEHDDSTCSNGMVLCTAVDDELDRAMYSIEDLENIGNNNEIPF